MEEILAQTENIAFDYLKAFGFQDEQVHSLITQGKADLLKGLTKLKKILKEETNSFDEMNNILHSLRGLLFQLGNHTLAEDFSEIEASTKDIDTLNRLRTLLS